MKIRIAIVAIGSTLFSSCYKDHLYVQQEWVDRNFLASSHVGTPDPRQQNPPKGQRLLIAWRFPPYLFEENLRLIVTVRFWDNREEEIWQAITRPKHYVAIDFPDQKILTYRVQVLNEQDRIIQTWEHHFWTRLIDWNSEAVSSQPRQGSVTETP